jgi:DNA-binding XRE family transcriptional regulator
LGINSRTIASRWKPKTHLRRLRKPYPSVPLTCGEQLRKYRIDTGVTRREVAQSLGVSKSSIDKWECNRTKPPARYHLAITRLLGLNPFDNSAAPTAE